MDYLCADGKGGFCRIINYDGFLEQVIKDEMLKSFYRETYISYHIIETLQQLVEVGMLERDGDDPMTFYPVKDIKASLDKMSEDIEKQYGTGTTDTINQEVESNWEQIAKENIGFYVAQ